MKKVIALVFIAAFLGSAVIGCGGPTTPAYTPPSSTAGTGPGTPPK